MRDVFAVESPIGRRWELALDLLRRGERFSLGRITFRRVGGSTVEAAVESAWLPENVTETGSIALCRLEDGGEVEWL